MSHIVVKQVLRSLIWHWHFLLCATKGSKSRPWLLGSVSKEDLAELKTCFCMTLLIFYLQSFVDTQLELQVPYISDFSFSHADITCSGKRSCEIKVAELVYHSKTCPKELISFFQASHNCLPGLPFYHIFYGIFCKALLTQNVQESLRVSLTSTRWITMERSHVL